MMTRKHYKKLAELMNEMQERAFWGGNSGIIVDDIIDSLCDILAEDNPRFDEDRFRKACSYIES